MRGEGQMGAFCMACKVYVTLSHPLAERFRQEHYNCGLRGHDGKWYAGVRLYIISSTSRAGNATGYRWAYAPVEELASAAGGERGED